MLYKAMLYDYGSVLVDEGGQLIYFTCPSPDLIQEVVVTTLLDGNIGLLRQYCLEHLATSKILSEKKSEEVVPLCSI